MLRKAMRLYCSLPVAEVATFMIAYSTTRSNGLPNRWAEMTFRPHDLRRFAGSKNAQAATLTENMARLGHKTVEAALRYQHSQDGRDAIVAANLSANALAELAAHAEKAHVPAGDPTCAGMANPQ